MVLIPLMIIYLIILIIDGKPAIHWSKRIGKDNKLFLMPKFRTMKTNSPDIATHLFNNPKEYITRTGSFLRKTSLDELPQILSCLKGEMNIIGPRPALHNQKDLIKLRTKYFISTLKPGITGFAQVNGRDEISIEKKIKLEKYYYNNKNLLLDLKILYLTFFQTFLTKNIKH